MDAGSVCGVTLPAQTDIVFGASFKITATELKPEGYYYDLCYSCSIQETATSIMSTFNKQIVIKALALDCLASLSDAGFANPATIAYNSGGSVITVVADYSDIFTHTL